MKTPIYDALFEYAKRQPTRFHMPGHKGHALKAGWDPLYAMDITEISGADSLLEATGIIAESEQIATALFFSGGTIYSCAGSTGCIQTMLALMKQENRTVIAARNVHRSFLNACVLLGLSVKWVYPETSDGLLSGQYTPAQFAAALSETTEPACVYLTSPDYLGKTADIAGIAAVCKEHNARLLVDNAHGAHLAFLKDGKHPIQNGADFCCDSAHKTLPCLTGCAYLHAADAKDVPRMKDAMSLFVSTSPSYLMLLSLDVCNAYLGNRVKRDLERICKRAENLKKRLSEKFVFLDGDPLHLTIDAATSGLDGLDLAKKLDQADCVPEYADKEHVVLLLSPYNVPEELDVLEVTLHMLEVDAYPEAEQKTIVLPEPEVVCGLREAALAEQEVIPVAESEGRTCAAVKVPCPPAVPIVCSGEKIDAESIAVMQHYGITEISVVRNV
jgi:arginine/lysine/ornithine decarboxylase